MRAFQQMQCILGELEIFTFDALGDRSGLLDIWKPQGAILARGGVTWAMHDA
jgi:hypothetical protein